MKTLLAYLTDSLRYDSTWAIYAEKIDGKFQPESSARFGEIIFDNGGLIDDYKMFADNKQICDSRAEYCGYDDDSQHMWEDWAYEYIEEINQLQLDVEEDK